MATAVLGHPFAGREVVAGSFVGRVLRDELTPFLLAQVTPDDVADHLGDLVGIGGPHPQRAVVVA